MSKLFESLRRAQGAISGVSFAPLMNDEGRRSVPAPEARPRMAGMPAGDRLDGVRRVLLRVPVVSPLLPFDGSNRYASEQYRMLRTRITQHALKPKSMVISSAGPRDGKSTTAINLAAAFALKSDAKILLIDADFRRATLGKQLGLDETPGLAEVLREDCSLKEGLIQTEQMPSLYVMTAGHAAANPSELLDSTGWSSFLAQCARMFRYVIVDSPPIGAVADFDLIQARCDGVILVARQDHTKREACLEALRSIPKEKLLGVVLNSTLPWPLDKRSRHGSYYNAYLGAS